MKNVIKIAAVAAAMLAAGGAYAGSDDGKSDNGWINYDIATQHMERDAYLVTVAEPVAVISTPTDNYVVVNTATAVVIP